ncbi:hypothetical protein T36_0512 [Helicobacter cinaedi]|uniref:hypothetical protein n=1 Tax=Helicobacter cinaedi TaxID=213 RepID=UPI001F43BD22|nr:hypothetical protein [Helicobacter cinaedi]BDB64065.1 hypothetical protein T36_0512 [Helicobacter cinaedi]
MRFLILMLLMWIPYRTLLGTDCSDLESLRENQNTIKGTLHKISKHNYTGDARLNGVLIWRKDFIQDSDGWAFRELVFYPDKNPLFDEYTHFTLYRDDIIATKFHYPAQHISNKLKLSLGEDWEKKYALSEIAVRAELTIFNYQYIDTDFIEGGIDFIEFKDLVLKSEIKQCFLPKNILSSLSYASKDPYINLRQSPNGKILREIAKDEVKQYQRIRDDDYGDICALIETTKNLGVILELGKDPTNPKWLKVAYIPPEAKDTSKAIYGVIHESQVSSQCEGF